MNVVFASNSLERCAYDLSSATQEWGQRVALRYIQRVELLASEPSLQELACIRALRLHPLRGDRAGQWALTLSGRWRLILELIDDKTVRIREVSPHYGD